MLEASDVPVLLRRSHVLKGYRPLHQPLLFYIKSVFWFHNELINIWTHAVPLLVLYFSYVRQELAEQHPRMAVCVLYVGIACLFLGSTLTHMMHSRSTLDHIFWLLVDFSGIAIFCFSVGIQRFACRSHNSPAFTWSYLTSLVVVVLTQYLSTCSLFLLKFSWKPRHAIRFFTCFLLTIWLYIPLYDRYLTTSDTNDGSLTLHTQAFMWLVLAGFFMGGNFPERVFPGVFDIFGYGHQLFHLCIMMVTWRASDGAREDCPFVPDMPADSVTAPNATSSVHTARGLLNDPNVVPMTFTLVAAFAFCTFCVSFFMLLARMAHKKLSKD